MTRKMTLNEQINYINSLRADRTAAAKRMRRLYKSIFNATKKYQDELDRAHEQGLENYQLKEVGVITDITSVLATVRKNVIKLKSTSNDFIIIDDDTKEDPCSI